MQHSEVFLNYITIIDCGSDQLNDVRNLYAKLCILSTAYIVTRSAPIMLWPIIGRQIIGAK